jgi:hypothetical protein
MFIPVFNILAWAPEHAATIDGVRALVNNNIDGAGTLAVTVEGVSLRDLFAYRAQSPPGEYRHDVVPGSIVETLFGYAPGSRFPAVSDGYWDPDPVRDLFAGMIDFPFSMSSGSPQSSSTTVSRTSSQPRCRAASRSRGRPPGRRAES